MNCKIVDDGWGALYCFVSIIHEAVPMERLYRAFEDCIYATVIFLDDDVTTISPYVLMNGRPRNIDVCFCGKCSASLYEEAQQLKDKKIIREIYVSTCCIYECIKYPSFKLGYECWESGKNPAALQEMDAGRIGDIADTLDEAEKVVEQILKKEPSSDLEKLLLVDIWMQENIQYIVAHESATSSGIYICEEMTRVSKNEDPLLNKFGRCEDIAFSAALILNHPKINIKCRQVGSHESKHSWNIVTCDGVEYYMDFTHNITRNPNKYPEALKAMAYSSAHTLLGLQDAYKKYGTTDAYHHTSISVESFSRDVLNSALMALVSSGKVRTEWDRKPVLTSFFVPYGNEKGVEHSE